MDNLKIVFDLIMHWIIKKKALERMNQFIFKNGKRLSLLN